MTIVTPEELEVDPRGGCTGEQEWLPDPYLDEVYGDDPDYELTEAWFCPGAWMSRKDDV